ncbi:MAG TPA: LPS export ABC transporter periplasmic protein LptC [Candidatus Acidoferrales bacterium]|nr:LPS export ABC transporter periplasmic protein LptC [Candidatus Acidoferrales bacterium]
MTRRLGGLLALSMLCACNPSVQTTTAASPSPSPTSSGIALKISGRGTATRPVRVIVQQRSRVQYDLVASSYESIGAQGSTRASFRNVDVTFHGRDGSILKATAPQAIVDQVTNSIEMTGGVHAKNDAGTTLACDRLRYDHQTEMLYGTGHVQIVSPNGFKATGDRFQSDISLTHTRME